MSVIKYIFFFSLVLFCACGESEESQKMRTKAEREKAAAAYRAAMKIGVMPTLDCLPIFLAQDHHLFDTTKVDIRLCFYNAQMDCDTALVGGSVQGCVSDSIRTQRLISKGTQLRYIAPTNTYWQLISNKAARIKELSQLSDKMVAMTRYSATDKLTDRAVEKGKPKYPVFRIQINDVTLRLNMLINNEMDAMWLPEPQATAARLKGNPVLMDSRKENKNWGVLVFRTKDILDARRSQQLDEFIKGYNAACDSINKYGIKNYQDLVVKYMHVDQKTAEKLPQLKFQHASNY